MNNDLISREALKKAIEELEITEEPVDYDCGVGSITGVSEYLDRPDVLDLIDSTPAVEITETEIQEVLNKKCMTVVTNEYLVALHGTRPQGKWKRHDEWRSGEYIGGFYHVNCPCEDGLFVKWRMKYCGNCGAPMQLDDEEEGEEHDRENNN